MAEVSRIASESHRISEEKLRLLRLVVEERLRERSTHRPERTAQPGG